MIEQLAKTLKSIQIDVTADDLADTLWLTLHMCKAGMQTATPAVDAATEQTFPEQEPGVSPPTSAETVPAPATEPAVDLHPKTTPGNAGMAKAGGLPLRSPGGRALPGELELARAMRPLMQRVPSRTAMVFDEEATVKLIAEQRIWMAVERAAPERWFTIHLVVDESRSMVVWQQTIAELYHLLIHQGAFRDVRLWALQTDASDGQLHLYPKSELHAAQQRSDSFHELADPTGRSLVLIVSDCVSSGWRQAKVTEWLNQWGERIPVAIIQVLPQRMWAGSILGMQTAARFSAATAGIPNSSLAAAIPDLLDGEEPPSGIKIPVLTLEPASLTAWARVVTGDSSAWVPGCIFETDKIDQNSNSIQEQITAQQRTSIQALTAEQRVERFLVIASPVAQQLAGYLAAAPLTLPVMRLVQQTMLPEARQVHLAEVFLGGLLKQVSPTDERNPDLIQYDFVDDQVRECFLDRILLPDAVEILRRVSEDIEKRMGYMLDFEALLEDPDGVGAIEMNDHNHPFANVAARVLRRLGGRYAHLGERLLQSQQGSEQALPAVGVLSDRQQPAPASDNKPTGSRHPLLPELVKIPAGPFLMGSSDADTLAYDDEKPQHQLELPTYWIGKTPVTNAQFRPFVAGDGYTNRDYWTEAGWQWREQEKIITPNFWNDAQWNGDDYPVVGINWFEAVAYCRWLSAQTGYDIRLPTEAEWEKAARGPDGRIWPWGNTWEAGRCNSEEAGEQRTTPVGSYPRGASPYGVLDMAGNVWEWCATERGKKYPYQIEDEWTEEYLAGDNVRRLRGGAWISKQKCVRGAYRFNFFGSNPRFRFVSNGLRLASHSLPPGSDE